MENLTPAVIGALFGLLSAGLVEAIRWLRQQSKDEAETDKLQAESRKLDVETELLITEKWQTLADKYDRECLRLQAELALARQEIHDLRKDFSSFHQQTNRNISVLKDMVSDLWRGVRILRQQLEDEGMDPGWEPDDRLRAYCERLIGTDDREEEEAEAEAAKHGHDEKVDGE